MWRAIKNLFSKHMNTINNTTKYIHVHGLVIRYFVWSLFSPTLSRIPSLGLFFSAEWNVVFVTNFGIPKQMPVFVTDFKVWLLN